MSNLQQSLAELCSVCYTSQPKYRCPRCKTQTCSLPCYKRHQQRASCNGQRDPAAYLRKSEWATPAGIDHDYNYLKTVERAVETGGQNLVERGIAGSDLRQRGGKGSSTGDGRFAKAWLPGSALQRYLSAEGIRVERAPVGMSRSKVNRTRVTPKGKVMWVVEWVEGDGERKGEKRTVDENLAESTVGELWEEVVVRRANAEAREKAGVKRKRGEEAAPAVKSERVANGAEAAVKAEAETDDQSRSDANTDVEPVVKPETLQADAGKDEDHGCDELKQQDIKKEEPSEDEPAPTSTPSQNRIPPPKQFYLEKPLTASKSRVLIPIDPQKTLTACLRGQTVLEYPTFYVFDSISEAFPEGYLSEGEYLALHKAERSEVDEMLRQNEQSGASGMMQREEDRPLDAGSILDMLRRDVGA